MTCEEAVKKLYEYIDKELDQDAMRQIDKHLEICHMCCDHFEFEKRMKSLVQENCFQNKAPKYLKSKIVDDLNTLE
jgi:mycothiol system anti-sigma-R factor